MIAADCWWLAEALVQQVKPIDAQPHAQRAVDVFTKLRHPDLEAVLATLRKCESAS